MRSIKPGRGPSMMGGVVGIFMILFGVVWTAMVARGGGIFALFGVIWTCIAVANTVYNFKNATGKNRYSSYDIVDESEEPDPFNERFGEPQDEANDRLPSGENRYCPYCGAEVEGDFRYCPSCGRELP